MRFRYRYFDNFLVNLGKAVRIKKALSWCFGISLLLTIAISLLIGNQSVNARESRALPVKAVIVTLFEIGEDTGDLPGELQRWVERRRWDRIYPLPTANHDVYANTREGVLATLTGIGTAKAASSIMALGTDPRFDLSRAYWLVAGISGVDPNDASVGSAAWAEWVVDGDLSHEIDAREMPEDWPHGYFARGSTRPNVKPENPTDENVVYHLNPQLTEWAYQLTKDVQLEDSQDLADFRANYANYPNAIKPPFVLKGDNLDASTFWHGKLLNDWANDWVKMWTDGRGNFVTSAMEGSGVMQSLTYLANAKKVDLNRVMVLRTASNYTMQYEGISAAESLNRETAGGDDTAYSGLLPSGEAAYRVGSTVIDKLLQNWNRYKNQTPCL